MATPRATQSASRVEEEDDSEDETRRDTGKGETSISKRKSLKRKIASPAYQKRNDILREMKDDFKKFYERKDKREEVKMKIAAKKLEESQKRNQIGREYLEFIKQKGTNPEDN